MTKRKKQFQSLNLALETDFIPVQKIEQILGQPLGFKVGMGTQETLLKGAIKVNMCLERSLGNKQLFMGLNMPTFNLNDPEMYKKVNYWLSKNHGFQLEPIFQFYGGFLSEPTPQTAQRTIVYRLELADTITSSFERELYLAEIELQNPLVRVNLSKELSPDYVGFKHGIFDEILNNIVQYGQKKQYAQIGIIANDNYSKEIFGKRGFTLENNPQNERAATMGRGFLMSKKLS
jgi:hypothetical protein